jgi:hypothetical protein
LLQRYGRVPVAQPRPTVSAVAGRRLWAPALAARPACAPVLARPRHRRATTGRCAAGLWPSSRSRQRYSQQVAGQVGPAVEQHRTSVVGRPAGARPYGTSQSGAGRASYGWSLGFGTVLLDGSRPQWDCAARRGRSGQPRDGGPQGKGPGRRGAHALARIRCSSFSRAGRLRRPPVDQGQRMRNCGLRRSRAAKTGCRHRCSEDHANFNYNAFLEAS